MHPRVKLALAFLGGMAVVAVPVVLYGLSWIRDWDRAWGYR